MNNTRQTAFNDQGQVGYELGQASDNPIEAPSGRRGSLVPLQLPHVNLRPAAQEPSTDSETADLSSLSPTCMQYQFDITKA